MSVRVGHRLEGRSRPPLRILLTTRLGWWAAGLGIAFLLLVFAAGTCRRGSDRLSAACAWSCGVVAIVRDRERALTLLLALVPLVIAVAFLLVELISGNP